MVVSFIAFRRASETLVSVNWIHEKHGTRGREENMYSLPI